MDEFPTNLKHLYKLSRKRRVGVFANAIGIERSVMSRLMHGRRRPNEEHLSLISKYFRIQERDLFLNHSTFTAIMENYSITSDLMLLSFRAIQSNLDRWEEISARYAGQYNVHYGLDSKEEILVSLLTIERPTKEGIEVAFINPYREPGGEISVYEYAGFMYPVRDYLYFVCEEKSADYDILSIIIHDAHTPRVSMLKGLISGIGVRDGISSIAARPILVLRRSRPIEDWKAALGREIGYFPNDKVPEAIRRQLNNERVTVTT